MPTFPIYILRLGKRNQIVFPADRADIGHTDFWESVVAPLVAKHYGISSRDLVNLPYCQRRARIVDHTIFYGEEQTPALLAAIRKVLGDDTLEFAYDEHEKRLQHDVAAFTARIGPSKRKG